MQNLQTIEQNVIKGFVLDKKGQWRPLGDVIAEEVEYLYHLERGEVLENGKWIPLDTVTEMSVPQSDFQEPLLEEKSYDPEVPQESTESVNGESVEVLTPLEEETVAESTAPKEESQVPASLSGIEETVVMEVASDNNEQTGGSPKTTSLAIPTVQNEEPETPDEKKSPSSDELVETVETEVSFEVDTETVDDKKAPPRAAELADEIDTDTVVADVSIEVATETDDDSKTSLKAVESTEEINAETVVADVSFEVDTETDDDSKTSLKAVEPTEEINAETVVSEVSFEVDTETDGDTKTSLKAVEPADEINSDTVVTEVSFEVDTGTDDDKKASLNVLEPVEEITEDTVVTEVSFDIGAESEDAIQASRLALDPAEKEGSETRPFGLDEFEPDDTSVLERESLLGIPALQEEQTESDELLSVQDFESVISEMANSGSEESDDHVDLDASPFSPRTSQPSETFSTEGIDEWDKARSGKMKVVIISVGVAALVTLLVLLKILL